MWGLRVKARLSSQEAVGETWLSTMAYRILTCSDTVFLKSSLKVISRLSKSNSLAGEGPAVQALVEDQGLGVTREGESFARMEAGWPPSSLSLLTTQ